MKMDYLLGIDLGTTNVKAIIMDRNGRVIASDSRANTLYQPGTYMAEQDAGEWWANTVSILRTITDRAGSEIVSCIRGISVSSHTVSMLPVDRDGQPLRKALIWMDSRSHKELDLILNELGKERFVSIVGGQPDVAFLPNKLLWFQKNEPQLFKKTYAVLQANSYINLKLTGKFTMDLDQAARSQCLDIQTLKWSDEIEAAIGIKLSSLLPTPGKVTDIIGCVTTEAAKETGLISGIPVVSGASDAMASMYATGLSKPGDAGESSGTTSLIFVGHTAPSAPDVPVVTKPCAIDGMPYVFDAPINTSGASIKWYLDTLGQPIREEANRLGISVYEHMNRLSENLPAGSNGLLYFPYLLGERAPLWNTHARGMFIGMSLSTTRDDFIRAVFEGTAFALRHVMETIKATGADASSLRITGGGAKSRTWSKIKASMLNIPVLIPDERAGDVPFGDALIAGTAVGVFTDLTKTMNEMIRIKEVIKPVQDWVQTYDELYPLYIDMYRHLDQDLYRMKQLVRP